MCEVNEAIAFNSLEKLLANDGTRTGNNKFVILIKKKKHNYYRISSLT